jgi:hypothetical protein
VVQMGETLSTGGKKLKTKKRPVFLLWEPDKLACRECGAGLHFHPYPVPLAEFLNQAIDFYQAHQHSDEKV